MTDNENEMIMKTAYMHTSKQLTCTQVLMVS